MRIGCDLDGVLADFNLAFIGTLKHVTHKDLFPDMYVPHVWNYPEALGYTLDDVALAFRAVHDDRLFWYMLKEYYDTQATLDDLSARWRKGDDVYFITNRQGLDVKIQTELWLRNRLPTNMLPTVLIAEHKAPIVRALNLDVYIDDKWENAVDVATVESCHVVLRDQPWNRGLNDDRIIRVTTSTRFPEYAHSRV